MEIIKQMILNLAILLVLLFLFQIHQEHKQKKSKNTDNNLWYFLLSVIVCYFLSTVLNEHFRYDLRVIPLILGCLYLPRKKAIYLYILAISIRSLLGISLGFYISTLIYALQTLLILFIQKWFHKLTVGKKIAVSIILSVLSSGLFIVLTKMANQSLKLHEWLIYILVTCFGTGIMCATFEFYIRNYTMRERIIKSEKIEAVSHLAASISHEVRNPLTSVKGFLQLINEGGIEEYKKKEFIKIALDEIDRAEKIISDYLTFAKPSLNTYEKINVSDVLTKVVNIIRPLSIINGIRIRKSLDNKAFFYGDFNSIQQCLINFLKNSVDAMPEGGVLFVKCLHDEYYATIIIKDTGVGMTKEQINKLGEPYFSTKGNNGTGLGMMVSYGIIRSMNGNIDVNSDLGDGTTFTITIPIQA